MRVSLIPNIMSIEGREHVEVAFDSALAVCDYLRLAGKEISSEDYHIIVGGKSRSNDLDYQPKHYEDIVITPDVGFTVAGIIAALKIILLAVAIAGAVVGIVAAARKPRKPSFGLTNNFGIDEGSPTYGWDGISLRSDVGVPVGVIYGEHRVGGNIINEFLTSDGDKNYLNILIALCNGEVDSISNILINDNPIANFDGIDQQFKAGTNDQTAIDNFEDLHNLGAVDANLNELDDTHTYTTVDSDVESFEVHLQFPNGMFSQNSETGDINSWAVTVKIEYAVAGSGSWVVYDEFAISAKSRSTIRRVTRVDGLSPNQYDIRVTRKSAASDFDNEGDMTWKYLDEIRKENLSYPNTALLGLRLLATDQLSGQQPNITTLVKGKKVSVPDIRDGVNDPVAWEDYYWKPADSTWRAISDDEILSWDGSTYVDAFSANPVWCVRDLLLSTVYGLGEYLDSSSIKVADYLEMAKYCEELVPDGQGGTEKRFRLDVVLDSSTSALDVLQQLATSFRGLFFVSEGYIQLKIDKPETPVQLFAMGNIVKDSFAQQIASQRDQVNMVEIQFLDKDKNYEQDVLASIDEDALIAGDNIRKKEVRIFCTRASQALREARFLRAKSKLEARSIQFKAGIDAIALQAGDVFNFAHDVPQWGTASGRVLAGSTTSSIVLDSSVTLEAATTYHLMIQFADDTIEEKTINLAPGTYSTVTVSSAFSQAPAAYDKFVVGIENIVTKPFRCINMSMANNHEVEIGAVEYQANIYDDSTFDLPTSNYSGLTTGIPNAQNLDLTEEAITRKDGTIVNRLHVWWAKADDTAYSNKVRGYNIYLSDNNQNSWHLVGYSEGIDFTIDSGIDPGVTYYVGLVSVTSDGMTKPISVSPIDSITTVGKTATPGVVSSFSYALNNGILQLVWAPNTEADIGGYEIRLNDANWGTDDANQVFKGLQTEYSAEISSRSPGTYYIRAFSTSGIYSPSSVNVTPTNSAPSAITNLGADIFFNSARLYWDNSGDTDVTKYQVYRSQTDAWGGEEELVVEGSGKSVELEGRAPYSGVVTEVTSDSVFKIEALEGLADDYFNKDRLHWTEGDNTGGYGNIVDFDGTTGQITLSEAAGNTVQVGDRIHITDVAYFKVRAFDFFGAGALSTSFEIMYEPFYEDMIPDNAITASKIFVTSLSALSADMGCLTAGSITGGAIQTANGGERLLFNSGGMFGYDSSCNNTLKIELDGSIKATSLCLVNPSCEAAYSYFSEGEMHFTDAQGHTTPYVKRIDFGQVLNGCWVCLPFWRCAPKIQVSANELVSYDAGYSASDQKWCIYADAPMCYCNCADDWGYKFQAHADLVKGSGVYDEETPDIAFNCSACTHSDACCTRVRMKFQLWANDACVGTTYCYGCLTYKIQYKCYCDACWCECTYSYCQDDSSVGSLKTDVYVCHNIYFGGCQGCYEVRACQDSLAWCGSSIPVASLQSCCRSYNSCGTASLNDTAQTLPQGAPDSFSASDNVSTSFSGTNPPNVQCNILCWSASTSFGTSMSGQTVTGSAGAGVSLLGVGLSNGSCLTCAFPSCFNSCNFSSIALSASISGSTSSIHQGGASWTQGCVNAWASANVTTGYLIQCYYPNVCCTTCETKQLYGTKDVTGALTILDNGGTLNWLAVAYG